MAKSGTFSVHGVCIQFSSDDLIMNISWIFVLLTYILFYSVEVWLKSYWYIWDYRGIWKCRPNGFQFIEKVYAYIVKQLPNYSEKDNTWFRSVDHFDNQLSGH